MRDAPQPPPSKSSPARRAGRIFARAGILFLMFLLALVLFAYGALWVICDGPSPGARDLFVMSCMETSFACYFPPLVLSPAEIADIQRRNAVVETTDVTRSDADFTKPAAEQDKEQPAIEIVNVKGATWLGRIMIVRDPSRIVVGTPPSYGEGVEGVKLAKMIEDAGAVGGINAGGFEDKGGVGNGGTPLGVVIKGGRLLHGSPNTKSVLVGFDDKNVLRVGPMTAKKALEQGMRDAVSFEPALIVNGQLTAIRGTGGGYNPRTAIGQREDGSVLLLVIDGRQPNSLGATYKELADVMLKYGAVNAGNLDGGSSSMLYYQGKLLSVSSSLYGPRKIATSFLVMP